MFKQTINIQLTLFLNCISKQFRSISNPVKLNLSHKTNITHHTMLTPRILLTLEWLTQINFPHLVVRPLKISHTQQPDALLSNIFSNQTDPIQLDLHLFLCLYCYFQFFTDKKDKVLLKVLCMNIVRLYYRVILE